MSMWQEVFADAVCRPCGKKATRQEVAETFAHESATYTQRNALHLSCATNCLGCGSSEAKVIDLTYDEPESEFLCDKCRDAVSPVPCKFCDEEQTWLEAVECTHGCPEAVTAEEKCWAEQGHGSVFNPRWYS